MEKRDIRIYWWHILEDHTRYSINNKMTSVCVCVAAKSQTFQHWLEKKLIVQDQMTNLNKGLKQHALISHFGISH